MSYADCLVAPREGCLILTARAARPADQTKAMCPTGLHPPVSSSEIRGSALDCSGSPIEDTL
ncbi:hypothetical protein Sinac_2751 [Singulisphaera acidiphila DSM 18658]|uniref:Uncharacterized protein n=1 Tax=Singulisphaera acidiphila (strain ATCC BAA-1392 / DSM 18658 / VKM B-2454 / MOB10) TaxID=886293 RepID=L0DCS8_SINAD|nr:hypothetical protein Sinac_2751 [Singulisphaera acidiphila DSM 18658]